MSQKISVIVKHYSGMNLDPSSEEYRETLGTIERAASMMALYAEQRHPGFQWPQGIARAVSVLTPDEMRRLDIDPQTVVWLDGDF